jgi:hypothetical protein
MMKQSQMATLKWKFKKMNENGVSIEPFPHVAPILIIKLTSSTFGKLFGPSCCDHGRYKSVLDLFQFEWATQKGE